MPRKTTSALFRINLFQRDRDNDSRGPWKFKTFGFFDFLQFKLVEEPEADDAAIPGGRHQRTLYAFGHEKRIRKLLDAVEHGNAYLAVVLVKLTGEAAHERYDQSLRAALKLARPGTEVLGCLDAPDLVVLKTFGKARAMRRLIDWMKEIRGQGGLPFTIERKLTMIACGSIARFTQDLAALDPLDDPSDDKPARAIVRITDRTNGRALADLRRKLPARIWNQLFASAGYYDVQGITSISDAAKVLKISRGMARRKELATSTAFIGQKSPKEAAAPLAPSPRAAAWNPYELLRNRAGQARITFRRLKLIGSWHPHLGASLDAVLEKFRQLEGTGFVPGSRLLLWTTIETLQHLATESDFYLAQWQDGIRVGAQAIHIRQRDFAELFQRINYELDRRVSLSLPAYTRFFPCAIEAPLKIVGALDVASRLVATTFRAYRCRARAGLLQVFSTEPGQPTVFHARWHREPDHQTKLPLATISTTSLSPGMLRHFPLALFSVFHEVAQCIFEGMFSRPSFSALVYSQAMVERLSAITTLISLGKNCQAMMTVPEYVWEWATEFLGSELGAGEWLNQATSTNESYFAAKPEKHRWPRRFPAEWQADNLFASQLQEWSPKHAAARAGTIKECFQLRRDAMAASWLQMHLTEPNLNLRWQQELHRRWGVCSPDFARESLMQAPWPPRVKQKRRPPPPAYTLDMRWCERMLQARLKDFELDELLELASLVPFLRLFHADPTIDPFMDVLQRLISQYFEVWSDWTNSVGHCEAARRFAVAAAAVRWMRQNKARTGPPPKATSAEADAEIQACLRWAVAELDERVRPNSNSAGPAQFRAVWRHLADTSRASKPNPQFDCHPLIVNCMVRFLIRLLNVYVDGDHVLREERGHLAKINQFLHSIFAGPEARAEKLPLGAIAQLWSMQYRLTQANRHPGEPLTLKDAAEAISPHAT